MLQAQSAFFNKGEMLRPYFIQSIMNPVSNQTFFEGKREVAGKPITPETAKKWINNWMKL